MNGAHLMPIALTSSMNTLGGNTRPRRHDAIPLATTKNRISLRISMSLRRLGCCINCQYGLSTIPIPLGSGWRKLMRLSGGWSLLVGMPMTANTTSLMMIASIGVLLLHCLLSPSQRLKPSRSRRETLDPTSAVASQEPFLTQRLKRLNRSKKSMALMVLRNGRKSRRMSMPSSAASHGNSSPSHSKSIKHSSTPFARAEIQTRRSCASD